MLKLYTKWQTWRASDEGATAVEYGIMVALIAAVIIAVVATIGEQLLAGFTKVTEELPALAGS